MTATARATIEDLYRAKGKAEIVDGEIVLMSPTGGLPGIAGGIQGAPAFAAEVRSEEDYGPAADTAIAKKRAEYFAAGTAVVWDVDLQGPETIRAYRTGEAAPKAFRRGELADAEPAVPGWRFHVEDLFA